MFEVHQSPVVDGYKKYTFRIVEVNLQRFVHDADDVAVEFHLTPLTV